MATLKTKKFTFQTGERQSRISPLSQSRFTAEARERKRWLYASMEVLHDNGIFSSTGRTESSDTMCQSRFKSKVK